MTELSKQEAMEYLKVSDRTLERWVKKYKVAVRYEHTEHGRQPFFSVEELDRVKIERTPVYHPAVTGELATVSVTQEERNLIQLWAQASAHTLMMQSLSYQLILGLNEAAMLSGLSKSHLVKAAQLGNLNARKIGRGWKVRSEDLEEYVDKLFYVSKSSL